ncbi:MAG: homocysteine S-methyltransferase family protein [Mogibacterium sp.]|nr:homocysteine S-methyltransferase family protein [Mogibacterium sp.]
MELYFPLVLDGANGTELQKRGYDGSVCTETWVLEHPEVMQQIQREYAEAGSDVVYTPTFGANRVKLEENGIFNQVADYNRRLVAVSKEAVGDKVLIAGDIATTGKFLAPVGDITFDELYDIYHEQAEALEEAGVDMYAIETIMTVPDARAALLAVRDVSDKPVLVSFTCDEKGRTLTGTDVLAALVILQGMEIDAFGINCSTGPAEMAEQAARLRGYAEVPLAIKPNAGLPETVDGKTVYNCPPEEFVKYTEKFAEAGAAMFGGCCGTGPEHIRALSGSLEGFELRKPAPEFGDKIVCATEKNVFILDKGIEIDEVIRCGSDLENEIREANKSDSPVIAVGISLESDLDEFEYAQYAIRKPLCIVCNDADLLEQALRLYQGRALYAGELTAEELLPLIRKYGLIA